MVLLGLAAWASPAWRVQGPVPVVPPPGGELLARDAFGLASVETSTHFALRWGPDADPDTDAVLGALETAWDVETGMGYPQPTGSETYLFNVYVGSSGEGAPSDLGAAGYFSLDPDGYPMLVLAEGTIDDPDELKGTSAHELFHALQYATGNFQDDAGAWFWEASAKWMEGQVWPEQPQYAEQLAALAWQPQLALSTYERVDEGTIEQLHPYGAFILCQYISEIQGQPEVIRDAWVEGGETPEGALDAQTGDLLETVALMAVQNLWWLYDDRELYQQTLADESRWPGQDDSLASIELSSGTDGWTSVPDRLLPGLHGTNLIRLKAPTGDTVEVQIDADGSYRALLVQELGDSSGSYGTLGSTFRDPVYQHGVGRDDTLWLVVASGEEELDYGYRLDISDSTQDTGEGEPEACGCRAAKGPAPWWLAMLGVVAAVRRSSPPAAR